MCYSVVSMVSQSTEQTAPAVHGVNIPSGPSAYDSPAVTSSTSGYSSYGSPADTPDHSPCDYLDLDFTGKFDNLSCQMQQQNGAYSYPESPSVLHTSPGPFSYSPNYPSRSRVQFNPGTCENIEVCGNPAIYNNGYGSVQGSNFSFFNSPQSIEEGMCFSAPNFIVQQQLCKICGDSASGNHFGVLSCEACKSFFRRSVRTTNHYACRVNRSCIVQKHTRNRCQYCRLQKCMASGMRKEAVQDERKPYSGTVPGSQPAPITSRIPDMSSGNQIYTSLPNLKMEPCNRPKTPPTPDASISALVDADMQLNVQTILKTVQDIKMDDLVSAICGSFTGVAKWAKRIPAFVSLSLDDQVKLLKSSWCEHCTLKLVAQNGPKAESVLLANGVSCNKDKIQDTEVLRFVDNISSELGYWLDYLNVDKMELACLKGILLFNPDAKGLSPVSKKCVGFFQEQILQSLETHTKTMYPVSPQRFSKLLLRLAPLKAISLEVMQHMEVQRALGNTKMDYLLVDFE